MAVSFSAVCGLLWLTIHPTATMSEEVNRNPRNTMVISVPV